MILKASHVEAETLPGPKVSERARQSDAVRHLENQLTRKLMNYVEVNEYTKEDHRYYEAGCCVLNKADFVEVRTLLRQLIKDEHSREIVNQIRKLMDKE